MCPLARGGRDNAAQPTSLRAIADGPWVGQNTSLVLLLSPPHCSAAGRDLQDCPALCRARSPLPAGPAGTHSPTYSPAGLWILDPDRTSIISLFQAHRRAAQTVTQRIQEETVRVAPTPMCKVSMALHTAVPHSPVLRVGLSSLVPCRAHSRASRAAAHAWRLRPPTASTSACATSSATSARRRSSSRRCTPPESSA